MKKTNSLYVSSPVVALFVIMFEKQADNLIRKHMGKLV
jgi:hypothetical protein